MRQQLESNLTYQIKRTTMFPRTFDELLHSTATTAAAMDLDAPPSLGAESPGQFSMTTPPPEGAPVPHASIYAAPPTPGAISFSSPPVTPASGSDNEVSLPEPDSSDSTPTGGGPPNTTPVRRRRIEKKAEHIKKKGQRSKAAGGAAEAAEPTAETQSEVDSNHLNSRPTAMLMAITRSQSDPTAQPPSQPAGSTTSGADSTEARSNAPEADGFVRVPSQAAAERPAAAAAATAATADPHTAAANSQAEARAEPGDVPNGPPPPAYAAGPRPEASVPPPPDAAAAAPPPPDAPAARGVEPRAALMDPACIQAIANLMQAARPPPTEHVPKSLQWPEMSDAAKFSGAHRPDFATWFRHYMSLTAQVPDRFRSAHLLGVAVTEPVRRAVEAYYQARGSEASQVPYMDLCGLIEKIYDPPDVVYRRVTAYLRLSQGERRLEDYLRDRAQQLNQLVVDGVDIDDHTERTLLVNSVNHKLREKVLERTDWWERSPEAIQELMRAHQKAFDSSRQSNAPHHRTYPHRPQRPLHAAAVGPVRSAAGKKATANPAREPELLAAAAQDRRGTASTQDMKQYYTDEQWQQRVRPNGRPTPGSDPRRPENAHLYNKDRNPTTGQPYCVNCRKDGHTLDQCRQLSRKLQRRNSGGAKRSGSGGKGSASKKRRE